MISRARTAGLEVVEQRSAQERDPFTEIALGDDWRNFGEGFSPLVWERRGNHINLVGLIEFAGEPEFVPPGDPELPSVAASQSEVSPPEPEADPFDPDGDDFDIETILIGTLPEGARPSGTLAFTVASDTLVGASEVHVTSDGQILLVLDDESDEQLDAATAENPQGLRKMLRRRRQKMRQQLHARRKLLRRRALKARRRCTDKKEVFLTGPSEISLSGITFRVKQ